ncbi:MAG: hypothetical protein EPO59_04580 [Bosea sp. (in: a-proteobacteria)]|nr:MAG: hypothetical protein EPO59_04580 [Bosea sp. (in: a-proteobacteria)]
MLAGQSESGYVRVVCLALSQVRLGLPDTIVTFHEGKAALAEVEAAEAVADAQAEADARGKQRTHPVSTAAVAGSDLRQAA